MVVVASVSKDCIFSENDSSTRQRYHYNNIVFKSFHFGDRFQKLSFSVKTIRLHGNDIIITISFSNLSTLETVFKSYRFQ